MPDSIAIKFVNQSSSGFDSLDNEKGSALVDKLDATNSPILFGCRTGICCTCAIRVHNPENCRPQTQVERVFFESVGLEQETDLRLSCQLSAEHDLSVEKVRV